MFIDFVGSTRLYDVLGDLEAKAIIDEIIALVRSMVVRHDGEVIKIIGDEVMCCFGKADAALLSAALIHEAIESLPDKNGFNLAVRIGCHYGSALKLVDDDLNGDAVNVAARVAALSRARQIILTEQVVEQLGKGLKNKTRLIDRVLVKGKQEKLRIYQLLWEPHDATYMSSSNIELVEDNAEVAAFRLCYEDKEYLLSGDRPCLMLGRGKQCDVIVDSQHASRNHALIEYHRGKYKLIDQSTNGTFVTLAGGREIYLRREEVTLWGDGVISIGTVNDIQGRVQLHFYS
jgi:adenylate cyclase